MIDAHIIIVIFLNRCYNIDVTLNSMVRKTSSVIGGLLATIVLVGSRNLLVDQNGQMLMIH